MPGHVFIAQGDLRRLACDLWLLPCDASLRITRGWQNGASTTLLNRLESLQTARYPTDPRVTDSSPF